MLAIQRKSKRSLGNTKETVTHSWQCKLFPIIQYSTSVHKQTWLLSRSAFAENTSDVRHLKIDMFQHAGKILWLIFNDPLIRSYVQIYKYRHTHTLINAQHEKTEWQAHNQTNKKKLEEREHSNVNYKAQQKYIRCACVNIQPSHL